jgi:trehalose 6-phosphate phosphatase
VSATPGPPPLLWTHWEAIARELAAAPRLLACFDYDGTLVPIRPTPEEAVAGPEVADLLRVLASAPATDVAVVSGRPVEELRAHLPSAAVWLIGHHGLALAPPGGEVVFTRDVEALRRELDPLRDAAAALPRRHPGVRLEDKGAMLALHTRLASRPDAAAASEAFRALAARWIGRGAGFGLLEGKEVLEVRPAGVDKGEGVERLLRRLPGDPLPFYVGDDRTDEEAFARLEPRGAVTVAVGRRAGSRARYRVDGPGDVLDLARRLARLRGA